MDKHSTNFQVHKASIIGLLFLMAFLFYGIGRNMFESDLMTQKYTGTGLIIANSIIVVFIGVLLRKTILKYNIQVANIYLVSRLIESIALASIVLNLIPNYSASMDNGYFIA